MIRSTTVICVRHKGKTAMAADGQVTMGQTILKQTALKIRRLAKGDVLAGFAGATSDAFALFARFETKLEEYRGNLSRAAIELAKDWRMDKSLRQLDALLVVANAECSLLISGTGDVIEPDEGVMSIGSGAPYALGAFHAVYETTARAEEMARSACAAAVNLDVSCGGELDVFTVKLEGSRRA